MGCERSTIVAFNGDASTTAPRTANFENVCAHMAMMLKPLLVVLEFNYARQVKRLRLKTHICQQKTYAKVVRELTGSDQHALVVWGDAI